MSTVLYAAGAVVSLLLLLAMSEVMVRQLRLVGERAGLTSGALGLLVAVGADSPEISTAVIALLAGSQEIGLGVVEGSNIYNLAGLLGLSAIAARTLLFDHRKLLEHGVINLSLTALVVFTLVFAFPYRRISTSVAVILFAVYLFLVGREENRERKPGPISGPAALALISTVAVVLCSAALVKTSVTLVHQLHLAQALVGLFILPIATSLPNTWAAISLARHGMGTAVVSTALASNSINLVFGVSIPSLFIHLRPNAYERLFDGPYLLAMSAIVVIMLYTSKRLSRLEGSAIIALYAGFVGARLLLMGR